jgi:hypothetical protein
MTLAEYIALHTENTVENPVSLPMQIDLGTMTQETSGWRQLLTAINTANKFVDLDLSACTMTGNTFDPVRSIETGKNKIVSIALPNVATSINVEYNSFSDPTFRYFTVLKSFSIGTGITTIGRYAFSSCTNLAMTELPAWINSIGEGAFRGCTNLALTELPAGLTSIGNQVFVECLSLRQITLPVGITTIGENLFYGCKNLTQITLLGKVTSFAHQAFAECTNLEEITIPSEIISIGDLAFHGCSSLAIVTCLKETPPTLGDNVFKYRTMDGWEMEEVILPNLQIKVPSSGVAAYKSANKWSEYADKIFAIGQ